jgi:flavin reductase (DIM6/NTAB) family NADH-FMN oxidoreductase RutF
MRRSLGAKTLLYPTPVLIVGTYDLQGRPNAMTASWGGICCSGPPCVAVAIRRSRHTYDNILAKKEFTVSIPSGSHVAEADYLGMVSGKDEDKFQATGLTPVRSDIVDAPYIKEFPLALECRMLHMLDLGQHTQFIGEILDVKAEEGIMDGEKVDVEMLDPFWYAPGSATYYDMGKKIDQGHSVGKRFAKK